MEKYEEYKTAFAELGDDTGDYQPLILQRQMASDEGKSLMDPTLEEIETVSSGNVTEPEVPGKTFDNGVLLETATEGLKSEDNNSNNIRKPLFLTVTSNPGPTAKKLVYRKSPRTLPAEA